MERLTTEMINAAADRAIQHHEMADPVTQGEHRDQWSHSLAIRNASDDARVVEDQEPDQRLLVGIGGREFGGCVEIEVPVEMADEIERMIKEDANEESGNLPDLLNDIKFLVGLAVVKLQAKKAALVTENS